MHGILKHASGYYVATGMDAIYLFIGSEGTLGVIVEAELKLLPKPEGLLSGVVFFEDEADLLAFVRDARERSLVTRGGNQTVREGAFSANFGRIDARALDYIDDDSLNFFLH